MKRTATLELPYPPDNNHYYRKVGKRVLLSRAGRRYTEHVGYHVAASGVEEFRGPVSLRFDFFFPDRRQRDLDNLLKAPLDALRKSGLIVDDSARIVQRLLVVAAGVTAGGRALVTIADL